MQWGAARPVRPQRVAVVIGLVFAAGCGGSPAPGPAGSPPAVEPVAACVTPDEQRAGGMQLTVSASATAAALVLGSGSTGLVLANQSGTDLCDWKPLASEWAEHGYRVLIFNYSLALADQDVLAAAAELRRRGSGRVFLIGASMGGTAALAAAAAAQPPVAGVISLSGPAAFAGVDAGKAMPKLTVPVLFLVGEFDEPFIDDAKTLYATCAAKDKKLEILPKSNHGTALIDERVDRQIQTFLTGH
jgi:pimeloyl-ACP methyl ester carboxylesterase